MKISPLMHKARTGALITLISIAPLKGMTKTATTSDIFTKSLTELVENKKVSSLENMTIASMSDGPKKHKLSKSCKLAAKSKPGVKLNKPKKVHRIGDKNTFENFFGAISDLFKSNRVHNGNESKQVLAHKKAPNESGIGTLKITLDGSIKREKNPQQINIDYEKEVDKDLALITPKAENVIPKAPSANIYYINTEGCPVIKY